MEVIMKCDIISDALDLLDDDLLIHTDGIRRNGKKRHMRRISAELFATAACLCLIFTAAAVLPSLLHRTMPKLPDNIIAGNRLPDNAFGQSGADRPPHGTTLPDADISAGIPQDNPETAEPFISMESLLLSDSGSDSVSEQALRFTFVPVEDYTGIYTNVSTDADLSACLGAAIPEAKGWYYVSGHRDMQYLIQSGDNAYTLWKFQCFTGDSYPYSDVLKLIYRLESPDAIVSIQVSPPTMINSDAGQKLQEQIGNSTITDRAEIEAVYQVLSSLTCYGSDRWDIIHYGSSDTATDGTGPLDAIRLGRYLSLVTEYGNEIDSLKYTAVSDMFYEFSGIAYNTLSEEQAQQMCEIFGIETE